VDVDATVPWQVQYSAWQDQAVSYDHQRVQAGRRQPLNSFILNVILGVVRAQIGWRKDVDTSP
jgi:hypothetical protein